MLQSNVRAMSVWGFHIQPMHLVMFIQVFIQHLIAAAPQPFLPPPEPAAGGGPTSIIQNSGNPADIPGEILLYIGAPVLLAAEILIPAAVAVSAIHKLAEHRETGMGTVVDLIMKGGGSVLAIQVIRIMLPN